MPEPVYVWHVTGWKIWFEPDDAKRKCSRSALQYVKYWVDGNADLDKSMIDQIKSDLFHAGSHKLVAIWQWLQAAAADKSHFRGYFLNLRTGRPALNAEIAYSIGLHLISPADVKWAIELLSELDLVERIDLNDVYEVLKIGDERRKVYLVPRYEFKTQAEIGGKMPPDSGAVTHAGAEPQPQPQLEPQPQPVLTASASGEHCETTTTTKTNEQLSAATGEDETNTNDIQAHRDNSNDKNNDSPTQRASIDNKAAHDGDSTPSETAQEAAGGCTRPAAPVRPDDRGTGDTPAPPDPQEYPCDPPEPNDGEPVRIPNAGGFAMVIFEALGWRGDDMKPRGRNNEKSSYKNKWIAFIEQADRLSLEPEAICDFATRRVHKAQHLRNKEVEVRKDDLIHGQRVAVLKARARIWMSDFTRQLAKYEAAEI